MTALRISLAAARRLGAIPKKAALAPAARALAKAKRERYEDLLWSQLTRYAKLQRRHGTSSTQLLEWSTLQWRHGTNSTQPLEWSTYPAPGKPTVKSFIARRQYEFLEGRKFKTDLAIFANPGACFLVEIDGGLFLRGNRSHGGGVGREADMERDALAMIDGWRVLRVSPSQVKNGKAIEWVTALLERVI